MDRDSTLLNGIRFLAFRVNTSFGCFALVIQQKTVEHVSSLVVHPSKRRNHKFNEKVTKPTEWLRQNNS
jgi:hypothetical protein